MAAVTTDIRSRRPIAGRPCHLAVGPARAETAWGRPAWSGHSTDGRALLPSRPAGSLPAAPGVYGVRQAMAVLVAAAVALVAWAGLSTLGGPLGFGSHPASVPKAAPLTVEVAPGDTFWSIASRLQAGGDPRPLVDRLVASHGGGVLRVGEHLAVNPS